MFNLKLKEEAGVKGILLVSIGSCSIDTIKICTDKPGCMIGKGGILYDKYKIKLQEINPKLKQIDFVETDSWFIR